MISSIVNLVYEFPDEFPNYLRLEILGNKENIRKIPNVGGDIAQRPVSPPGIKLPQ